MKWNLNKHINIFKTFQLFANIQTINNIGSINNDLNSNWYKSLLYNSRNI